MPALRPSRPICDALGALAAMAPDAARQSARKRRSRRWDAAPPIRPGNANTRRCGLRPRRCRSRGEPARRMRTPARRARNAYFPKPSSWLVRFAHTALPRAANRRASCHLLKRQTRGFGLVHEIILRACLPHPAGLEPAFQGPLDGSARAACLSAQRTRKHYRTQFRLVTSTKFRRGDNADRSRLGYFKSDGNSAFAWFLIPSVYIQGFVCLEVSH
jgi:hypothetical protein